MEGKSWDEKDTWKFCDYSKIDIGTENMTINGIEIYNFFRRLRSVTFYEWNVEILRL